MLKDWLFDLVQLSTLNAQIDAVHWAKLSTYANFASIAVSFGALIGLLTSLRHTKLALKHAAEANKLSRLERRPWLGVNLRQTKENFEYRPHPAENYAVTPIQVQITNHGGQPAIFCNADQAVEGIEDFDPARCSAWESFENNPFREVIFPGQTIEKTILFQTPLAFVKSANTGKIFGNVDQISMSGGLHIGVIYVDADHREIKARTTILIRWQTFVPATIFRKDESWQHHFTFYAVSNTAT